MRPGPNQGNLVYMKIIKIELVVNVSSHKHGPHAISSNTAKDKDRDQSPDFSPNFSHSQTLLQAIKDDNRSRISSASS